MIAPQAKNIINLLSQKWRIKDKEFLLEIIKYLDKKDEEKYSFHHDFEFSLIENEPKIRLLHLFFWQPKLPLPIIREIVEKRKKTIIFIFRKISKKFNCFYDFSLLNSLFDFNQQHGLWPVQFALEYQKNFQPKIKVYLSIEEKYSQRKKKFSLKKFCQHFSLNYQVIVKDFKNKKFDTVAVDFTPANEFLFKLYPYFQNQGFVYRISPSSRVDSMKKWKRFPQGIRAEEIVNKLRIDKGLEEMIKKNKFKIHYFCSENNKKSIYFR